MVGSAVYLAKPAAKPPKKKKPTLDFWSLRGGKVAKRDRNTLENCTAETGIDLKYVAQTNKSLKMGTRVAYEAGDAPAAVIKMPWPARIKSDAKAGHLTPLGDIWEGKNFIVSKDPVTVEGKTYAVPWKVDVKPGFWYRKSFFEEHNLTPPDTYDEFKNLLEKISNIEGVEAPIASGAKRGWPLSDVTEAFLHRQSSDLVRKLETGEADFTDPKVKQALMEIVELRKNGYFSAPKDWQTQYTNWWEGKHPLYFMGSWTPHQPAVKDPTDLGVFALPGTKAVTGSSVWLTVPKYTKHKEKAKRVVDWLTSVHGQAVRCRQRGMVPANAGVPREEFPSDIMWSMAQIGKGKRLVFDLDDTLGDPFQEAFWGQLVKLWQNPSEKTVDEVISTLETKQNKSLE